MNNLKIIIGSTRNGRIGDKIGKLTADLFKEKGGFDIEIIDLKDWSLPFFNEIGSIPSLKGNFSNPIINKWTEKINEGDAYVLVTPEYNHGYPAVLKNAIDYAFNEWSKKPITFVSYSTGPFAGVRAVEQLRAILVAFRTVPMNDALHLANMSLESFDENNNYKDYKNLKLIFEPVYKEVLWWTNTLKYGRENIK